MEANDFFGPKAGEVWKALKSGEKTLAQLQRATGLTPKEISMGLGWLAREGKIRIRNLDGLYLKFELMD
jgi:hypothetical protein